MILNSASWSVTLGLTEQTLRTRSIPSGALVNMLRDGWYKVTELEPAAGFTIKEPATQEVYADQEHPVRSVGETHCDHALLPAVRQEDGLGFLDAYRNGTALPEIPCPVRSSALRQRRVVKSGWTA